jgi:hypothetical protein
MIVKSDGGGFFGYFWTCAGGDEIDERQFVKLSYEEILKVDLTLINLRKLDNQTI